MQYSINKVVDQILAKDKGTGSFEFTDDCTLRDYERHFGDVGLYTAKIRAGIEQAGYKLTKIDHDVQEAFGALGQLYRADKLTNSIDSCKKTL